MEARIATSATAGALGHGGPSIETRIAISSAAEASGCGDWRFYNNRSTFSGPLLSICGGRARNASFCRAFPYLDSSLCVGSLRQRCMRVVCAAAAEREVYQPFRPPPDVLKVVSPAAGSPEEQLEILRERRGFWHEYAGVLPALTRAGYTPSQVDEATGVTGVEQNTIVGASQVRLSLKAAGVDDKLLSFFDVGGAELLYELRILSTAQRRAAAEYIAERKMNPKECKELARSIKDFERRKRDEGWKFFSSKPGDCLAFSLYRQSKEVRSEADKELVINRALCYAVTESARTKLAGEIRQEGVVSSEQEEVGKAQLPLPLPVVRLPSKEDTEGSPLPVIIPAANDLTSVVEAPFRAAVGTGPFNVYSWLPRWKSWIAVPGWPSIVTAEAPIGVLLDDVLPTEYNQGNNEPVLVVVDKFSVNLEEDAHFLVEVDGRLALLAGYKAAASNRMAFGKIIMVLKPPLPDNEIENLE